MRVAALISGGKDSALALHRILRKDYDVRFLVTMLPLREDSWMFHYPNLHLTDLFSKAAEIPLVKSATSGIKEKEVHDLKETLASLKIDGVVSGSISSQYQKERIDRICTELNLKPIFPLWNEDPIQLLEEIINLDFEVLIIGVYAYGFDENWLGRKIDAKTLDDLIEMKNRHQISPVGEGGEYETLVIDAPFFKKRIELIRVVRVWEDYTGSLKVKEARLVDKAEKVY